jgi:mitochondrial translocator assembly and maintenance protein 41
MNREILKDLISTTFPSGIEVAIGYGSGVFEQKGYENNKVLDNSSTATNTVSAIAKFEEPPMIDMIFVVNDETEWHAENLKRNPSHYAMVPRLFGASFISTVQRSSAQIYYNTLVPMPDEYQPNLTNNNNNNNNGKQLMKYGVIRTSDFIDDLVNWNTLYLSGRLQKPVAFLNKPDQTSSHTHSSNGKNTNEITKALQANLYSALSTAILLLPSHFSELDLYKCITSLSYEGDFRMGIAENPNKIDNIVNKGESFQRFRNLYGSYVNDLIRQNVLTKTKLNCNGLNNGVKNDNILDVTYMNTFQLNLSSDVNNSLLMKLPKPYQQDIQMMNNPIENDKLILQAKHICKTRLRNTVSKYSRTQTLKGVLTAGFSKGLVYSLQKILKRLK